MSAPDGFKDALEEVRLKQEKLKQLLKKAGVREPWNLDRPYDLYAARAIRLGGL